MILLRYTDSPPLLGKQKSQLPGDSIRDLFIPDRWRSLFTLEFGSREFTIPKRSRKRRIAINYWCCYMTSFTQMWKKTFPQGRWKWARTIFTLHPNQQAWHPQSTTVQLKKIWLVTTKKKIQPKHQIQFSFGVLTLLGSFWGNVWNFVSYSALKLAWQLKIILFSRKYIFKWSIVIQISISTRLAHTSYKWSHNSYK